MAYTPINWQTGDTITAEKLNRCDNGWEVSSTQLFSETLTTASGDNGYQATMAYTGDPTNIATMYVTFDGTDYTCAQASGGGTYWYGAPDPSDFSQYPFVLLAMDGAWYLVTETAGTHTVTGSGESVEVSDNFSIAVRSTFVLPIFTQNGQNFTCNMTFSEVKTAITSGGCCYALQGSKIFLLMSCSDARITFIRTLVTSTGVTIEYLMYSNDGSILIGTQSYPSN